MLRIYNYTYAVNHVLASELLLLSFLLNFSHFFPSLWILAPFLSLLTKLSALPFESAHRVLFITGFIILLLLIMLSIPFLLLFFIKPCKYFANQCAGLLLLPLASAYYNIIRWIYILLENKVTILCEEFLNFCVSIVCIIR